MSEFSFKDAISKLRSMNSLAYDEGFQALQGELSAEHLEDLITMMKTEADPEVRGRLIELIGGSNLEQAIPVLEAELCHANPKVRYWALFAMKYLDSPSAAAIAAAHIQLHPEDQDQP